MSVDLQKAVDLSNSHGIKPFNNIVDENMLFKTREYIDEPVIYARKIRFYPTTQQKTFLKKAFGVSRLYYNESIELFYKNRKETIKRMDNFAKEGCVFHNKENKQCKKDLHERRRQI